MRAPTNPISVKWSGMTPTGSFGANHPTSGRSTGITHDVFTRDIIRIPGWKVAKARLCRYAGLTITVWTTGGTLAVRLRSPRQPEKVIGGQPVAHPRLFVGIK